MSFHLLGVVIETTCPPNTQILLIITLTNNERATDVLEVPNQCELGLLYRILGEHRLIRPLVVNS